MSYDYFVAIDRYGQAGLAATKRSIVEAEATETGGNVYRVAAANAFLARRQAVATWEKQRSADIH